MTTDQLSIDTGTCGHIEVACMRDKSTNCSHDQLFVVKDQLFVARISCLYPGSAVCGENLLFVARISCLWP